MCTVLTVYRLSGLEFIFISTFLFLFLFSLVRIYWYTFTLTQRAASQYIRIALYSHSHSHKPHATVVLWFCSFILQRGWTFHLLYEPCFVKILGYSISLRSPIYRTYRQISFALLTNNAIIYHIYYNMGQDANLSFSFQRFTCNWNKGA